jgi:hypothetical protein
VRTNFLIALPAASSIQRLTASAADTMATSASIQSRLSWQIGRACRSCSVILNAFSICNSRW